MRIASTSPTPALRSGRGETGEPGGAAGSITAVVPSWLAFSARNC
jgi:hypothetical protein